MREIFHALRGALQAAGLNTNVGDEGGFAPNLKSAEAALDFVMQAIEKAGYKPGGDVMLALDRAATEFFKDGAYVYEGEGKTRSPQQQADYLAKLIAHYPIVSIEDGMAEDDWDGWKPLTERSASKCQLVGDDLFVTNVKRLAKGIKDGVANSILVKVNQIELATPFLMPSASRFTLVTKRSSPTSWHFPVDRSVRSFQPSKSSSAMPSSIETIG